MSVLAVLIAASTLLFVCNVFGVIYGLLAAAALWFIAVTSCLYALLDIRSDLLTFAPASSGGFRPRQ